MHYNYCPQTFFSDFITVQKILTSKCLQFLSVLKEKQVPLTALVVQKKKIKQEDIATQNFAAQITS